MDSLESQLQKLETGEQPRDWNLYKIVWKLDNFSVICNNAKLIEMTPIQTWHATFVAQLFPASLMAIVSLIRAFPYGCGSALGKSMSITISLITGPFDDILSWPFKGTIQISVSDNTILV